MLPGFFCMVLQIFTSTLNFLLLFASNKEHTISPDPQKINHMKRLLYLLLLLTFSLPGFAQDHDDTYTDYPAFRPFELLDTPRAQIGLFAATMPFIRQQSFGGGGDVKLKITNAFSLGVSGLVTGRTVEPKFGYNIGEAKLVYYDISVFPEFTLYHNRGLEAAVRLYTGFSAFNLADNSIKEKYWYYDEYGFEYEGERALPIANNYFLRVAPAFVVSYRVARDVSIEASGSYSMFFGQAKYAHRSDFNNYVLQLGVRIDMD